METPQKYLKFGKTAIGALLLGAMFLFVSAPLARADEREHCRHQIEHAEHKLDDAIRHHGEHSPEAHERRHQLYEVREECWRANHGWWDGRERRWHEERWEEEHEDHDHDHDHDR